jgi:hypothetical protein
MKVDLLALTKKNLYEKVVKPTKKDKEKWGKKDGDLHYVIKGKNNEVVEYIDSNLVQEFNDNVGKKYSPKTVANKLLEERGILKTTEKEYEAEASPKHTKAKSEVNIDINEEDDGKPEGTAS